MSDSEGVRRLTRWENAGGVWRVVGRVGGQVTIALRSCDGAEEMARFSTTDVEVLELVGERRGSDD